MAGAVVVGFGRGSRDLAVPTANIDPAPLQAALAALPRGVYFGWARLDAPAGSPAEDSQVQKMVMNIGRRPTVNTGGSLALPFIYGHPPLHHPLQPTPQPNPQPTPPLKGDEAPTVEVHILHDFAQEDFHGARLSVVATSFLRPEMRFESLAALQRRIKADIGIARSQLDAPELQAAAAHTALKA